METGFHGPIHGSKKIVSVLLRLTLLALVTVGCSNGDGQAVPSLTVLPTAGPTTAIRTAVPPTLLPPTWTPRPTLTLPPPPTYLGMLRPTYARTPRPTPTLFALPTRTRAPEIEAALRRLSDLPVITAKNAARLTELTSLDRWAQDAAVSPDGTLLAIAESYEGVVVFALDALDRPLRRMGSSWYWPGGMAYSPDGTRLVAGYDDGKLRTWDPNTGAVLRVDAAHEGMVWAVAFSPDGRLLASGGEDGVVLVWDAATGAVICELKGRRVSIYSLVFRPPDGALLVSSGYEDQVRVWDVAGCAQQVVLEGHWGEVRALAFSPDGSRLATGGYDATVRVWDTNALTGGTPLAVLDTRNSSISSLAFSPDGKLLAAGGYEQLLLWDATTQQAIASIDTVVTWPETLFFSPNGRLLFLGGPYDPLSMWGVTSGG